jgi:hypothetical protein
MREDNTFQGWRLEHWSLQHDLLELSFHFWPLIKEGEDLSAYNAATRYRGKALFSRPARAIFANFVSGAAVEKTVVSGDRNQAVTYRFSLGKDAFVEIEAETCVSVQW